MGPTVGDFLDSGEWFTMITIYMLILTIKNCKVLLFYHPLPMNYYHDRGLTLDYFTMITIICYGHLPYVRFLLFVFFGEFVRILPWDLSPLNHLLGYFLLICSTHLKQI